MQEFWNILTSDAVFPFSLLLIPFGIYWVIFSLGFIDLDVDVEVDTDLDVDMESDAGATSSSDPGIFHTVMIGVLRFMNAKDVPIMLVLTLIAIFTWVSAMLSTILLPGFIPFLNGIIAIGSIIVGVILTKLLTKPLTPLFKFIKSDEPADPIIGKSGTVRSHKLTEKNGQVEVFHRGTNALLTAKLQDGTPPVTRGTEVLIFKYNPNTGIYTVTPL